MSKKIKLVNSEKQATVDDDNFAAASEFTWYFEPASGYAFRYLNGPGSAIEYMQDWVWKRMAARN